MKYNFIKFRRKSTFVDKELSLPKDKRIHNYISNNDIKKAIIMRKEGMPYREIGECLGFSHSVIIYHLNKDFREKNLERHKNVSSKIKLESVKRYQKRFEEIVGINKSTLYYRRKKLKKTKQ